MLICHPPQVKSEQLTLRGVVASSFLALAALCCVESIRTNSLLSTKQNIITIPKVVTDFAKKSMLPGSCCTNTKLTFLQRYRTCEKGQFFLLKMPRIDPAQLLRTLSQLLSPQGGIKSAEEVKQIYFRILVI